MINIMEKQKVKLYVVKNGKLRQIFVEAEKGDGFVYYAFMSHKEVKTGKINITLEKIDSIEKFCGAENIDVLHVDFEKMNNDNPYKKMFEILYNYAKTKINENDEKEEKIQ